MPDLEPLSGFCDTTNAKSRECRLLSLKPHIDVRQIEIDNPLDCFRCQLKDRLHIATDPQRRQRQESHQIADTALGSRGVDKF